MIFLLLPPHKVAQAHGPHVLHATVSVEAQTADKDLHIRLEVKRSFFK